MQYLAVLFSNILTNVPTVLLVLIYSHFGTFVESARLGVALAYVAPLYLLFSMQHGLSILGGTKDWEDAMAIRTKFALAYFSIAALMSVAVGEYLVLALALYRLGDLWFEPYFCEKTKIADPGKLLSSSSWRLVVFTLGLAASHLLKLNLLLVVSVLAVLNFLVTFCIVGVSWIARIRSVILRGADILMGGAACLASLSVNVPRYFLTQAHEGDLAAYSNILTVVMAATLMFVSFNNMYFSRCAVGGRQGVLVFYIKSLVVAMGGISLTWIFCAKDFMLSKFLIANVFGVQYLEYAELIFMFWIFYCLLYLQNSVNCVLIYARASKLILVVNILLLGLLLVGFFRFFEVATAHKALVIVNIAMAMFVGTAMALALARLRTMDVAPKDCPA